MITLKTIVVLALLLLAGMPAAAEIYIYRGADGERMISDRPLGPTDGQYELLSRRDSLVNAGHILANRKVDTDGPAEFRSYIRSASKRYEVDPALVEAIIVVESGFNPQAVSNKGASGLMQLMLPTAQQYRVIDRFDPQENIRGGVQHLSQLLTQFEGDLPLVLAAYNAGIGAVEKHNGVPPFPETQRYIEKVLARHAVLKSSYVSFADD